MTPQSFDTITHDLMRQIQNWPESDFSHLHHREVSGYDAARLDRERHAALFIPTVLSDGAVEDWE